MIRVRPGFARQILRLLELRQNFIERVFAYYRWTEMLKSDPTPDPEVAWMLAVVPWPIFTRLMGLGV